MEYKYTINPMSDKPIMLINDTIGGEGIDGGDFQRELLQLDTMNKSCIEIMINSAGGSVFDGFSIASAILNCKTHIITNNVGIAGSIAGVIFMCGKQRNMADYALLMMHNVTGGNDKSRKELNNSIALLLSKNSSLSQDQVKNLMKVESWLNYEECMKNNFSTGMEMEYFTQKQDTVVFSEKYAYNEIFDYANNIINDINMKKAKTEIDNEIPEVTPETNEVIVEETITEEVNETEEVTNETVIENKVNPWAVCTASVGREDKAKYESCVMKVKKENGMHNDLSEEEYMNGIEIPIVATASTDYENALNAKDVRIKELEAEIAKIKADEVEKDITNFIEDHIQLGKISEDTKEKWLNLCKVDFDNAKEIIKSLHINKEAPKLENTISGEKKPQSFLEFMNFKGKK